MATLGVETAVLTGLEPTANAAAAGGDVVPNDGRTVIVVANADASPHDVTVSSPTDCNQGGSHDAVVTVPAGEKRVIGPFKRTRFNNGSGQIALTYSDSTGMTVEVISVPRTDLGS